MATQSLGIIMHGVTGRMGMNQHLIRSIVAIRNQGGVTLSNGDRVMPDPILIGRNAEKIEALAKAHGGTIRTGKMSIGEYGYISLVHDTEGNLIGLHSMQ